MINRTSTSIAATVSIAVAALMLASCGIEAAEQVTERSPAEAIAEKFAGKEPTGGETQIQIDLAQKKAEGARRAADEAKRAAAAKKAEEKSRKEAAAAAAKAAEQTRADEAEMLAQARAEAEQRRAEMETARAEREHAELAAVAADKARAEAEVEQQRLTREREAREKDAQIAAAKAAEAQRVADEMRAAEQKRLAEEKLIAEAKAQAAAAEEQRRMAEEQRQAARKAHEARLAAEAKAAAEAKVEAERLQRIAEEQRSAEQKALEARRDAESKQLAERLRAAEAAREARVATTAPEPVPTGPALRPAGAPLAALPPAQVQPTPAPTPSTAPSGAGGGRFAVLLVMEPGNKGIRRFDKSADPILCVRDGCYISEGPDQSARLLSRGRALGIGNTWGRRAGACQHSLGCVFRDVDLAAAGGIVQPVDMKVMVHDRREAQTALQDSDCRTDGGRLACRRPVAAAGYRMWVVPEALARSVGGSVLDNVVREGLPQSTSAGLAR